jgi:hypothetical protein
MVGDGDRTHDIQLGKTSPASGLFVDANESGTCRHTGGATSAHEPPLMEEMDAKRTPSADALLEEDVDSVRRSLFE